MTPVDRRDLVTIRQERTVVFGESDNNLFDILDKLIVENAESELLGGCLTVLNGHASTIGINDIRGVCRDRPVNSQTGARRRRVLSFHPQRNTFAFLGAKNRLACKTDQTADFLESERVRFRSCYLPTGRQRRIGVCRKR